MKNQPPKESISPAIDGGFGVPIALFNFNRPQMTRRVFDIIRQIKPRRLLLVADGPRSDRPDDAKLCDEVRAIFDEIDWECEVSRNFAETNMGSFERNSSGLNWVFSSVEEAIILEDDCIPSLSFFPYCEELLDYYRNNPRVGVISGVNFGFSRGEHLDASYFFSAYPLTWGWASWRRVWQRVDLSIADWESATGRKMLRDIFPRLAEWQYWFGIFEKLKKGEMRNAWDYQLILTSFREMLYCAIPRINLVSNIGFHRDSTHCTDELSPLQNYRRNNLSFPLVHPTQVQRNPVVDHRIFRIRFMPNINLWKRASNKLRRILDEPRKARRSR